MYTARVGGFNKVSWGMIKTNKPHCCHYNVMLLQCVDKTIIIVLFISYLPIYLPTHYLLKPAVSINALRN